MHRNTRFQFGNAGRKEMLMNKELGKQLKNMVGARDGERLFYRYKELSYDDLKERYERFVRDLSIWEVIDRDNYENEAFKPMLDDASKEDAAKNPLVHDIILDVLLQEEKDRTAVAFVLAVKADDEEKLKEIIEKRDPDGEYERLLNLIKAAL